MKSTTHKMVQRVLLATTGLALLVVSSVAVAVPYVPGNDWAEVRLAAAPRQLGPSDDYPGQWEYVYDLWGGSQSWTRFVTIDGFDADAIANIHTAIVGEDIDGDGTLDETGIWQRWDSHSVGGFAPWGNFRENSIYPSYWNAGTQSWDLASSVGGGNWPGQNTQFELDNIWHTGDEYAVTETAINAGGFQFFDPDNSFRRWPGIQIDTDGQPGNDGVQFDSFVHAANGWGFANASLELTFRIVHPNAPGSITWSTFHNTDVGGGGGPVSVEGTITGPGGAALTCIIGDVDCDGFVDIAGDILPAFTNFTGPGSFGKVRSEGDVHGTATGATTNPAGHDGDVDVSDVLAIFGAFTGPPPDEGSGGLGGPAEAGDPSIPDLIYDAATGEVTLDPDGSSIIGYSLQNATNSFLPAGHTPILAGVTTALTSQIEEAALAPGSGSIGLVFPTGLDLAGLTALLSVNQVSRFLGAPLVPFDLVVVSGVAIPEPTTTVLWLFGMAGVGLATWRRRRRA
ncbi:MAG: PEP-CTERM sorting domain-containing protein [Planctomycetota bacterium]|nr:MAG: PEP-CTERM sorting domain-containing protein [Planctomycetota bacterium]REJ92666.1 MAG: PEP-CTERM sorting domain-containing protein [Planctomycetota bacterium]REK23702.1 MAG: PEP-CTERM sorting domain-containing protein [Planctomycetota bacterium]REK47556.1 MAG: PEP-CTERM sorting domain-containing protein [Planctomycetota bacterium]